MSGNPDQDREQSPTETNTGGNSIDTGSDLRRRDLFKQVGTVGFAGLLTTGIASGEDSSASVAARKVQHEATQDEAERAVSRPESRGLLKTAGNPSVDEDAAVHIEISFGDDTDQQESVGHSVKVPTDVGQLSVTYLDDDPVKSILALDRGALRGSHRRLSRNMGWPEDINAALAPKDARGTVAYYRGTTGEERRKAEALVSRDDDPVGVQARRPLKGGPGEYQVVYADAVYHLSTNLNEVVEVEQARTDGTNNVSIQGHGPGCVETGQHCLIDIITNSPHCVFAGIGCSITGPATLGCLVLALDLCLPNVALVYVSGNCAWVFNNCQDLL